jgi:hypothetical protein
MSPDEADTAIRAAWRTPADHQIGAALVMQVLRAVPSPPADAPVAVRHAHLRQIIQEICAFDPRDAIEAMLVVHIIVGRHAAADMALRSLDPALSASQVAQLVRCEAKLLRATRGAERTLAGTKKERARRRQERRAPMELRFDLEAIDALWCGTGPAQRPAAADPARAASPWLPRDTRPPAAARVRAEPVKFTMCGQRADQVQLATIPPAGTA